jgi:hypothetical protein
MAKKKRRQTPYPVRLTVKRQTAREFAACVLRGTHGLAFYSGFYRCAIQDLVQKSKPYVIVPGHVTREMNYPLCIFRASLGDELMTATLN